MSKIAIIGLGYVGLPLAYEFSKIHDCTGYDISKKRIFELKKGIDKTEEYSKENILNSKLLNASLKVLIINTLIIILSLLKSATLKFW